MEEDSDSTRYWCHQCSRSVIPILEDEIKCPRCHDGFLEEIDSVRNDHHHQELERGSDPEPGPVADRALSLWAPILLGMMSNPRRPRRFVHVEFGDRDEEDDHDSYEHYRRYTDRHLHERGDSDLNRELESIIRRRDRDRERDSYEHYRRFNDRHRHEEGDSNLNRELESIIRRRDRDLDHDSYEHYRRYTNRHHDEGGDAELNHELEAIIRRRRRRSSAAILQLLQGAQVGMISESENYTDRENEGDDSRERGRVILINPFNQTIVIQGSGRGTPSETHPIGSLGDYFGGTGLELLLQHLAENDPNRHGTPPAQKEAVEALPTVTIKEPSVQCSICLDDFEVGIEAKEMPCKHSFHSKCILPWLELHSSCPVCRYELPTDELRPNQETSRTVTNSNTAFGESEDVAHGENGDRSNSRRFSVSLPWPFSTLFSSTTGNGSSSAGSSSAPQTNEPNVEEHHH